LEYDNRRINNPNQNPFEDLIDDNTIQSLVHESQETLKVDRASIDQVAAHYIPQTTASPHLKSTSYSVAISTLKTLKDLQKKNNKNPKHLHKLLRPLGSQPPILSNSTHIHKGKGREVCDAEDSHDQVYDDEDSSENEDLEISNISRQEAEFQRVIKEKGN
jgi:hypothetical protein